MTPAQLQAHLRRHNRDVLFLSVFTLVGSALLWVVLFGITWWLYVLAGSALHPPDWQPQPRPILHGFVSLALLLCLAAALERRLRPNLAPRDQKSPVEILLDFILAPPRATLAIAGTAFAWVHLDEHELLQACNLLERLGRAAEPLPVQEVPQEIPHDPPRAKILMTLQLSELIEVRRGEAGPVVALCGEKARRLVTGRVRLRP